MFNDPTGHFSEKQLIKWFGDEWRSMFSEGWQFVLREAEFGDVVVYGDTTTVFALGENGLCGWDVNTRDEVSIFDVSSGSGELALYRPKNVNQTGDSTNGLFTGEIITPENSYSNGSNNYLRVVGDPENTESEIILPWAWYTNGSDKYVETFRYFTGLDLGITDFLEIQLAGTSAFYAILKLGVKNIAAPALGKILLVELGGAAGLAVATLDLAQKTQWDTIYVISSGNGPGRLPIVPLPTPPPN